MSILKWGKKREAVRKAEGFLTECCQTLGLGEKILTKSGQNWVGRRKWGDDPFEIRRLVCYAALTARGNEVGAGHFPPRLEKDHEAYSNTHFDDLSLEDVTRQKLAHFFVKLRDVEARGVHRMVIEQVERALIGECLKWAGGNQIKASRVLGINRNTLRKKMRKLGRTIRGT